MKQHFLNARDSGFLQLSDRINKLSVQARLLDVKSHLKRQKTCFQMSSEEDENAKYDDVDVVSQPCTVELTSDPEIVRQLLLSSLASLMGSMCDCEAPVVALHRAKKAERRDDAAAFMQTSPQMDPQFVSIISVCWKRGMNPVF